MNRNVNEWLFVAILSLSHGVQHFFSRLIPPLIPILLVELDMPLWKLGLLISIFSLGSGFGQAPVGILSDTYDRRYILPPGLAILSLGYVAFGLAPFLGGIVPSVALFGYRFIGTFLVMSLAMLVSGVGASVTHPTGYPLISANVGSDKKGKALGMWGSVAKVGDAAAPATIGLLILTLMWNEILLVLGALGAIYAVVLFILLGNDWFDTLPSEHTSKKRADADDEDDTVSIWDADRRLFIYPMLAVVIFFTVRMIATKGVSTFTPVFIVDAYGYSFTYFGLSLKPESFANFYFSALLLTAAVVQLLTGGLTDLYDHRKLLVGFLAVATVALLVLSYVTLAPLALFVVLLVVGGALWGLNPARDALISDISPEEREGRTFGYLWTIAQIIGAFSPVLIGYIAGLTGIQDSFKYLALATLVSGLAIALLFSDQVYKPADTREVEQAAD